LLIIDQEVDITTIPKPDLPSHQLADFEDTEQLLRVLPLGQVG
jgi:hypothetical protein